MRRDRLRIWIGAASRRAPDVALARCVTIFIGLGLVLSASAWPDGGAPAPADEPPRAATEYRGGQVFTGKGFVEASLCVEDAAVVACTDRAESVVNVEGGFIIPPLADAHTHHFDSPYTFAWQRSMYLDAGIFYAMTMTAPTSGVQQIRDRLSGPKNVDVVTALGGITGPESHPAEIYEALALGIRSFEEQVARAEEIHNSRKSADDAYFVVETAAEVKAKWPLILENKPDLIKVFLRSSEGYAEGFGKWGPGGGIDPSLLPLIRDLSAEAGLRLAVSTSSLSDFRVSIAAKADVVTHLPCYQDTMSDPESPYYGVDTAEACELTRKDAEAAAAIGMASVLIMSEWAKERPEVYVGWERRNVSLLEAAGAPLAVGSNAYGSTVIDGLVAGAQKRFFEPARLLRLATTETARVIMPDRRVACLEPGCEASFLVLDGNPLEDFSRIRAIRLRVKDGEPLAAEEIGGD